MTFWPQRWAALAVTLHPPASERADQTIIGCMDDLSLVMESGAAQGWLVRGWAALQEEWSHQGELTIMLRGEACSFEATVARETRPDVAEAHGGTFGHSGYRVLIPVEPLADGDYSLFVRASCGLRSALLDTGHKLSVRGGRPWLRGLEEGRLLQVVHVPKTAGTTFKTLLGRALGRSLALHYEPKFLIGPDTRCIQGHHYASSFLRFAPDIRLTMWFRDPVERAISEYFHWRRHPETHPLDGEDLLTFCRRREMVNIHRRCLDGLPLARIDCVCITENFRASSELFCRLFGFDSDVIPPQNTNPDKVVGSRYTVPDSVREQIALANRADIELHRRATERFAHLCRVHGIAA